MRPIIQLTIGLCLAASASAGAGTFERGRIAPELGVDALTRGVAREQLGRDVFRNPWAAVTVGSVDVYDVFPYVESRTFEIVSDPAWNRLVYGEAGRTLRAFDGAGTAFGPLRAPRGLATDERNRLYVADTGNDRILVMDVRTEFGDVTLTPAFAIRGLAGPYGVAYSDGGTPFVSGDDFLYVADTGKNRIVAYSLQASGATAVAEIGALGSGEGRFAGPMAITAGRSNGASTRDVYVADAHTRRIIRLAHDGGGLRWVSEAQVTSDIVTSLDTDPWGNVYAAAPRAGRISKFNGALVPVAELNDVANPRGFHVPMVSVSDHRAGTVTRTGRASGLAVEQWSDGSGMQLWNLGLELNGLALADGGARFALTDRAAVTLEFVDAASGAVVASRTAGNLDAGPHAVTLAASEAALLDQNRLLRVRARSAYEGGATVTAQVSRSGDASVLPAQALLIGHSPNPMLAYTRIAFAMPVSGEQSSLDLFDAGGRRVRHLGSNFAAGLHQVVWDGADDAGHAVAGGVYFYRLEVGAKRFTHKLVVVR